MQPHSANPAARPRRLLVALASCGLLISTAAGVHAADGDGLDGFFRGIFGQPAAAPAPVPAPVPAYGQPDPYGWAPRSRVSAKVRKHRPKIRYVALPKPEAPKPPPRPVAAAPGETLDARTALLRDPTLRPGDIVVLPEGPRVFRGDADDTQHRMSDFEDVRSSKAVDARTRRELLAMTTPVGALPADEARKLMAKFTRRGPKPADPAEPVQARAEASLMRVIYPAR
ncbi:hypothetical protein [uncultured Methylobacterium sp.]|jgi:hypothetical protein|uniref:hypothetical protein n=1 Tax=uncultured Methylobacterium sp. TaxID=157278 RepID=UPI002613869A|nr:hypothetical protein [uncultured Methylobacterium sp.]